MANSPLLTMPILNSRLSQGPALPEVKYRNAIIGLTGTVDDNQGSILDLRTGVGLMWQWNCCSHGNRESFSFNYQGSMTSNEKKEFEELILKCGIRHTGAQSVYQPNLALSRFDPSYSPFFVDKDDPKIKTLDFAGMFMTINKSVRFRVRPIKNRLNQIAPYVVFLPADGRGAGSAGTSAPLPYRRYSQGIFDYSILTHIPQSFLLDWPSGLTALYLGQPGWKGSGNHMTVLKSYMDQSPSLKRELSISLRYPIETFIG